MHSPRRTSSVSGDRVVSPNDVQLQDRSTQGNPPQRSEGAASGGPGIEVVEETRSEAGSAGRTGLPGAPGQRDSFDGSGSPGRREAELTEARPWMTTAYGTPDDADVYWGEVLSHKQRKDSGGLQSLHPDKWPTIHGESQPPLLATAQVETIRRIQQGLQVQMQQRAVRAKALLKARRQHADAASAATSPTAQKLAELKTAQNADITAFNELSGFLKRRFQAALLGQRPLEAFTAEHAPQAPPTLQVLIKRFKKHCAGGKGLKKVFGALQALRKLDTKAAKQLKQARKLREQQADRPISDKAKKKADKQYAAWRRSVAAAAEDFREACAAFVKKHRNAPVDDVQGADAHLVAVAPYLVDVLWVRGALDQASWLEQARVLVPAPAPAAEITSGDVSTDGNVEWHRVNSVPTDLLGGMSGGAPDLTLPDQTPASEHARPTAGVGASPEPTTSPGSLPPAHQSRANTEARQTRATTEVHQTGANTEARQTGANTGHDPDAVAPADSFGAAGRSLAPLPALRDPAATPEAPSRRTGAGALLPLPPLQPTARRRRPVGAGPWATPPVPREASASTVPGHRGAPPARVSLVGDVPSSVADLFAPPAGGDKDTGAGGETLPPPPGVVTPMPADGVAPALPSNGEALPPPPTGSAGETPLSAPVAPPNLALDDDGTPPPATAVAPPHAGGQAPAVASPPATTQLPPPPARDGSVPRPAAALPPPPTALPSPPPAGRQQRTHRRLASVLPTAGLPPPLPRDGGETPGQTAASGTAGQREDAGHDPVGSVDGSEHTDDAGGSSDSSRLSDDGDEGTLDAGGMPEAPGAVPNAATNSGDEGDVGSDGEAGDAGSDGDVGSDGDTGDVGSDGEAGDVGSNGDVGGDSDTGDAGSDGDVGSDGEAGDVGGDSGTGDAGSDGDVGADGDTGNNGEAGERWWHWRSWRR